MSLKARLNNLIRERNGGMVTLQEIEYVCREEKKKTSNAERRLRASESPNVERVFKNGAIIGYRWKTEGQQGNSEYCPSCGWFITHSPSCPTQTQVKEKEPQKALF